MLRINRTNLSLRRLQPLLVRFLLLYLIYLPTFMPAQDLTTSGGAVYLANRGQLARSRNFYADSPHWEDVSGRLPIPFNNWGGITEFTLDPFDPINRAWVSLGSSKNWVGSLWMTENLNDTLPTWTEILSQQQILAAIGGVNLQVSRVQASTLQEGLIYIVVFRGNGSVGEVYIGRSDNYGSSWTWGGPCGNASDAVVGFEVSEHVIDRLWLGAGAWGKSRLFISNDGGASFTNIAAFDTWWHPYDIFVPKENNENDAVIYVVVDGKHGWTRLMYSETGGNSWKDITDPNAEVGSTNDMVNIFSGDPGKLYYASTRCEGPWSFMYSDNGGQTWEKRYTISKWWSSVWQSPASGVLLTANAKTNHSDPVAFLSTDGGYTWLDKTGDWTSTIGRPYLGQPGTCGSSGSITIVDAQALSQPIIAVGSDDAGVSAIHCAYAVNHNEIYFGECANRREIVSGFRFPNVLISRPEEIQAAHIEFTADGPYANDIQIQFWGEAADNAQTFSDDDKPSDRPLTTQSVTWTLNATDVWNMGEMKNSPDLTAIIQEIVARPGWQKGNAVSIIVKNVNSHTNHRRVFAFERAGSAYSAKLIITRKTPEYVTVAPTEIDLGSDFIDSPFQTFLTIKNGSNQVATGRISENADWIMSVEPEDFELAASTETKIKISGRFPVEKGPFQSVLTVHVSLPVKSEIKVPIYGNATGPKPTNPLLSGSFVWTKKYVSNRTGYQALLDEMKALNLTTIILLNTGHIKIVGDYPNESYEITDEVDVNTIGWMLDEASASRRGMKVYVGMFSNDMRVPDIEFWRGEIMNLIIENSLRKVTEIEQVHGLHPALEGYYVPQEANVGQHIVPIINNPFYTTLIARVHQAAPYKKVIAGGYMLQKEVELHILKQWIIDFKSNGLDIFLLQDGVGSFDNSMITYPTIYNHFVAAREGAFPKPLWAVIELFQWSALGSVTKQETNYDNWYHPANTIRLNQQIYFATEAGAVEKISWIHEDHLTLQRQDAKGAEAAHLFRGYKALYFTGTYYENPAYTYNPQPSSQYPDKGGMLFDKIEGQALWSEWVGIGQPTNSSATITIDLGEIKPVSDVTAVVRTETNAGIYYPTKMLVKVSTDGTNYNSLGSMDPLYVNNTEYSKAYFWISANASQPARYVQIEFIHGGYWLFLSELEVYYYPQTQYSIIAERTVSPREFSLRQNYPNPFNPATTIQYGLPKDCLVTLKIYNLAGQEMATLVNEKKSAGEYEVHWKATSLPSGIYFYRLQADDFLMTKKFVLVK